MRIAYVGNFSQAHCTEVHIARTLRDMGHTVIQLQENGVHPARLIGQVEGADLFLFTRTWGGLVTTDHLRQLKRMGIPTASYHLDLYVGLKREAGLDTDPFWLTDFVFTPDGSEQAAEVFKAKGINHTYLKPGVLKLECVDGNRRPELAHDVVFVGGGAEYGHPEWPYRKQLVNWLETTYRGDTDNEGPIHSGITSFGKYGWPQATMRNQDLNDLYASSKVVVGDSVCLGFNHPYYWSDRVYETIGRGGFIIHPYIKGMEEEFTDGETIVFYEYNNFGQLKEKIDYYLEHEDERQRIRKAGQQFVREHATYHNRLQQALGVIAESEARVSEARVKAGLEMMKEAYAEALLPEEKFNIAPDIKINLGAGADQFEGYVNVDLVELPGIDVVHNLMEFPYPFENGSASEIKAVDVLEHLDHYTKDARPTVVAFIEECYRILKPGGELYIQTPGWNAEFLWDDPTHVRGFTARSMDFFDPDKPFGQTTGFYSKAKFNVRVEELENHNLRFYLTKR